MSMNVYLGDVGQPREQKTLMPMTGGYLSIASIPIERRARLSSGKLVVDVITVKRRFTVSFAKIFASDFEVWEGHYQSGELQELEIQERDGTYSRHTVDFAGDFSAQRFKTRDGWLYAGVEFVLEEQ
jgi:hypothetical protein